MAVAQMAKSDQRSVTEKSVFVAYFDSFAVCLSARVIIRPDGVNWGTNLFPEF